ncbi:MAG: prepilin peptidase [Vicinamibacterales bacterium]
MTAFEVGAVMVAAGACATDLARARVPNTLTVLGIVVGVVAHAVLPGGRGAVASLVGGLAGLGVFFPFFALGGMGGGDVKLMAALGAWVGAPAILFVALYTALAGGVLAVGVALAHNYLGEALRNLRALARHWAIVGIRPEPSLTLERGRGPRLPYAVAIFAGLIVTLWR